MYGARFQGKSEMQRIKHENSYAMVQFMTPFVGYLETIIFRPTAEWNFIIGERYQLELWSFLGVEMTDTLENGLLGVYEGNFQFHSTPDHPIGQKMTCSNNPSTNILTYHSVSNIYDQNR